MTSQATSLVTDQSQYSVVIDAIENEIAYLSAFDDVYSVILFRLDGRVLDSYYSKKNSQTLLFVIRWVKDIISKTMEELKSGSNSVKYDKDINSKETIPVYFYRAGNSSIVVTILNSRANTGLLEIEMNRTARRLGRIIDTKKPITRK